MRTLKKIIGLCVLVIYMGGACKNERLIKKHSIVIKDIDKDSVEVGVKISLIDTLGSIFLGKAQRYKAIGVELVNNTNTTIIAGGFNCVFQFRLSYYHEGKYIDPMYTMNWKKDCLKIPDTLFAKNSKKVILPFGFNNTYYEEPYPLKGDSLVIRYYTYVRNSQNKKYTQVRGKGVKIF